MTDALKDPAASDRRLLVIFDLGLLKTYKYHGTELMKLVDDIQAGALNSLRTKAVKYSTSGPVTVMIAGARRDWMHQLPNFGRRERNVTILKNLDDLRFSGNPSDTFEPVLITDDITRNPPPVSFEVFRKCGLEHVHHFRFNWLSGVSVNMAYNRLSIIPEPKPILCGRDMSPRQCSRSTPCNCGICERLQMSGKGHKGIRTVPEAEALHLLEFEPFRFQSSKRQTRKRQRDPSDSDHSDLEPPLKKGALQATELQLTSLWHSLASYPASLSGRRLPGSTTGVIESVKELS